MRYLKRILLVFLILATIVIGVGVWGYSCVETEFGGVESIEPKLNEDPESVLSSLSYLLLGDFVGASKQLIESVMIKGTIDVNNSSYVPLFVPDMEHQVIIDDNKVGEPFITNGGWLGPRKDKLLAIEIIIPLEELPETTLEYIFTGGDLTLKLESYLKTGPLSFTKTSTICTNVNNPVLEQNLINQ